MADIIPFPVFPTRTDDPAEVGERVLAIIDRPYGWCRGAFQKNVHGTIACCLQGAIDATDGLHSTRWDFEWTVKKVIQKSVDWDKPYLPTIPGFNNHPKTTKRQVIKVVKEAIKLLRAEAEKGAADG